MRRCSPWATPEAIGPKLASAVAAAAEPTGHELDPMRGRTLAVSPRRRGVRVRDAGPCVRRASRAGDASRLPAGDGPYFTPTDGGALSSRPMGRRKSSGPRPCACRSPCPRASRCRRAAGRCSCTRTARAAASAAPSPRGSRVAKLDRRRQRRRVPRRGARHRPGGARSASRRVAGLAGQPLLQLLQPAGRAGQSASGGGRPDFARSLRVDARLARRPVADGRGGRGGTDRVLGSFAGGDGRGHRDAVHERRSRSGVERGGGERHRCAAGQEEPRGHRRRDPVVLEDDPSKVGEYHPVLALLQNDLDGVDPLDHAQLLVASPGIGGDAEACLSALRPGGHVCAPGDRTDLRGGRAARRSRRPAPA